MEFTAEQRKPGVKNPLTKEQIANLTKGWGAFYHPSEEEIQQVAEELLPQGASLEELQARLIDFM